MTRELFAGPSLAGLPLPERIPCVSLWEPYASLVIAGVKTIETRTWPWPYGPSWLAIHKARHVDQASLRRLDRRLAEAGIRSEVGAHLGAVGGLVYVTGGRPLLQADEAAACFYAPDRHAWLLAHPHRLAEPIVMRGPQKFVRLQRDAILAAQPTPAGVAA